MGRNEEQFVQFSLEETVWFKKGQEVKSIRTLSLEPDVHIEEEGDYFSLKGVLQLYGEYEPCDGVTTEEETLREISPIRTISEVSVREDGVWMLYHNFPIDVSIPRTRVTNADDVSIRVQMFDYDLPNESCIEVKADVAVTGIFDDEEDTRDASTDDGDFEEFEVESVYKVEVPQIYTEVNEEEYSNVTLEEVDYVPTDAPESHPRIEIPEPIASHDSFVVNSDYVPPFQIHSFKSEPDFEEEEVYEEVAKVQSTTKPDREENALYLTKFFSRNEEPAQSKLKMYFVQYGDSIHSVATRFNVPIQHIHNVNNLTDESLTEGQILYIPLQKASK